MFENYFLKILPFIKYYRKMWWSQRGRNLQFSMVYARCMLDKQSYTHARTRPRTRAPTHAHSRAHRKHTEKYAILIASPRQQRFRERAATLRCMYIAWSV
jgi:hypothetical protein